jgi:mannosyltransferase OCH1-like enzyme
MSCVLSEALQKASEVEPTTNVPKIIHQTWKTTDVPEAWTSSQIAWKKLHPTWTYILWTDADIDYYMKHNWPDDYVFFKMLPWNIQRVDVWRYYVLRDFGGVYSDLDIEPIKNIESFIDQGHIQLVPSANSAGVFTNAFMISSKSDVSGAFWTLLIEDIIKYVKSYTLSVVSASSRHLEIMESTGPLALTRIANSFSWPITILPKSRWNPYDLSYADIPNAQTSDHAIVKLLPGSSWHESDSSFFSFLLIYKGPVIVLTILIVLFYVVKSQLVASRFNFLRKLLRRKGLMNS